MRYNVHCWSVTCLEVAGGLPLCPFQPMRVQAGRSPPPCCRSTSKQNFTTAGNEVKQVQMMFQKLYGGPGIVRAAKQGVYDGIGLPYKGGAFRALALLPEANATFDAILEDLAAGAQVRWAAHAS